MARSDTISILPLDRYAQRMRINQYHFNNLDDGNHEDACKDYWMVLDHDELAVALQESETKLADYAGWDMGPVWRANERIPFNLPRRVGRPWQNVAIRPKFGKMIALGTRTKELIEADVAVSRSGGVATVSVTGVGGMDNDEIRLYYTTSDGAPAAGDDAWQIRPLSITQSSGTATITAHEAQFVLPAVLNDETGGPYPYADAANYVDTVDAYRVYNDDTLPVSLLWDVCGTSDIDGNTSQTATGRIIDFDTGRFQVRPATDNSGTHVWATPTYAQPPESVVVNYYCGNALRSDLNLEREIETAIIRLGNAIMPCEPNDYCEMALRLWTRDRAQPEIIQPGEETAPFGILTGALAAFRIIRRRALVGAGRI